MADSKMTARCPVLDCAFEFSSRDGMAVFRAVSEHIRLSHPDHYKDFARGVNMADYLCGDNDGGND